MSMFNLACHVGKQVNNKKQEKDIWQGSTFEFVDNFSCDGVGDWGEEVILRILKGDPILRHHGGTQILGGGHYDFMLEVDGQEHRMEQKTARLNADGKSFQHESLNLDGSCESFLFLDVCPEDIYLTVLSASSFKHGERHEIMKRTPHLRDKQQKYKVDWTKRICESRGIPGGVTMKIDKETSSKEVLGFIKNRLNQL